MYHFCGELWPCPRGTTGYGLMQEEGLSCPVGLVLEADKTTCMPFAQMILLSNRICCMKYNFDVVSMYLSS